MKSISDTLLVCGILFLPDSFLPSMLIDAVVLQATELCFVEAFPAPQQIQ
jgi:hypothetical protein